MELTSIDTSIGINHTSFALLYTLNKLTHIHKFTNLVFVIPTSVLYSIVPLAFIILFRGVQNTSPVFNVICPCTRVECVGLFIVIGSSALLKGILKQSIVDFTCGKEIHTLTVEQLLFPGPKVHIPVGVEKDSLSKLH